MKHLCRILVAIGLSLAVLAGALRWGDAVAGTATLPHLQDELIIEPLGHYGGWLGAVALPPPADLTGLEGLSGLDTVYLGEGSGFTVLDVSDPRQPRLAGSLPLDGDEVGDIVILDTASYLVNGNRLTVLDLSEPISPTLMGKLDLPATAQALGVSGSHAYVAAAVHGSNGWLYAVDVSHPAAPLLAGSYDTPGMAYDIHAAGSIAYVADGGSGLQILDVTDAAHPVLLGAYDTPGAAEAVVVADATAYVADGANGLQILDVSSPASPTLLGAYDTPGWALDVQVSGHTAYVADGASGLCILDVSDPAAPALLGTADAGWPATKVAIFEDRAYVASEEKGLRILDVSNPASPAVLGDYERPSAVMDVIVDHPYGYVAGWHRLWVLDMSDPALPVPLGASVLQDLPGEDKWLSLSSHPQTGDPLVYVAERYYGLEIFNVDDPTHPSLLGAYPLTGVGVELSDVFANGEIAYLTTLDTLAGDDGWLHILDGTDPTNPTQAGAFDTPGDARRVCVADSIAYVADGEAGLQLIDVSNPNSPAELGHVDPPAGATTDVVFVTDDRAYIGSNTESGWWLQAFDVSDPANPTLSAEQQDTGHVNDMDVDEEYVYLAVTGTGGQQMHSRTAAALIGPDDPAQETVGMKVHDKGDLTPGGEYQTKGADSVHRYSISIAGIKLTYVIIDKRSGGMETVGVAVTRCSVLGIIDPEKAKADGCTMSPEGVRPCQCGVEDIPFTATATNGWEFMGFNPQPPIRCPAQGQTQVVARFGPILTVSGGGAENVCVGDEQNVRTVLRFSLLASQADHWEVSTLTFEASGDGDDARNVQYVKLFHEGVQKGGTQSYDQDNGTVEFTFPKIHIPAGGPAVNFTLEYSLDYEGMEECGSDFRDFLVRLAQHDILPQNYRPGVLSGSAAGGASIGCVMHEDAAGNLSEIFDTLQDAVDAASPGTVIQVCPGEYAENVQVNQTVRIYSKETPEKTHVTAANPGQPVFSVVAAAVAGARTASPPVNHVSIEGLQISGGTVGVFIHSGVNNVQVGGEGEQDGNLITGHSNAGVVVANGSTGVAILGNRIFGNEKMAIDLGDDGPTLDDLGDGDAGANNLQNYPLITGINQPRTTISGTINTTPNTDLRVELFLDTKCSQPGEPGDAEEFLGYLNITTDGNGWTGFVFNAPRPIPAGQAVVATATDGSGNTSELSPCPENLVFKVENDGDVFADGTYQTPAADFAELWPLAPSPDPTPASRGWESLEPGDVLALGPDGGVMLAGLADAGPAIGVYASQPGFLAGGPYAMRSTEYAVPVALAGIVPVKVSAEVGPIRPGDLLALSSTPGVAARAQSVWLGGRRFYLPGTYFGKALESFDGPAMGIIRMLLIGQ